MEFTSSSLCSVVVVVFCLVCNIIFSHVSLSCRHPNSGNGISTFSFTEFYILLTGKIINLLLREAQLCLWRFERSVYCNSGVDAAHESVAFACMVELSEKAVTIEHIWVRVPILLHSVCLLFTQFSSFFPQFGRIVARILTILFDCCCICRFGYLLAWLHYAWSHGIIVLRRMSRIGSSVFTFFLHSVMLLFSFFFFSQFLSLHYFISFNCFGAVRP